MPTLADITEGHSKRISAISRRRDSRLHEAVETRDRKLRAKPSCAPLYDEFDAALADSRARRQATDSKAEAARSAALQENSDALATALENAHQVRRDADVAAFEKRRQAEADAEHEFILAIGAGPNQPSINAQRIRAEKMERARKEFEQALAAAQEQFRKSRDAALMAESRGSRDADRAFTAAARVSEVSATAAQATAEQALARGLARIADAAEELAAWKSETAAAVADFKREENEEFARFHEEVQALRH
jgi:hypothetical protein